MNPVFIVKREKKQQRWQSISISCPNNCEEYILRYFYPGVFERNKSISAKISKQ